MDNYFYYSNISKKDVIESFNENSLYENFTQEGSKPKAPTEPPKSCYVYSNSGCKKNPNSQVAKSLKKNQWFRDSHGEKYKKAGVSEDNCANRVADYNNWCGETDYVYHYVPENPPKEETLVEVAPVEEAPVEEAPVEEAPVEEAPVEETPVEETPVEETPVEETQNEESSESDDAPEPQVLAKIRPDIDISYLMLTAAERKTIDEVVSAIYPTFILFNYITTKFDIISYRYNISKEYTTFSVVVKTNKMYEKEDKNELLTIKKFPDGKTELENPKNISFTSGIAVSIYFIVLIILLIILLS